MFLQFLTGVKSENDTNDLHKIIEQLKSSNNTLKDERDAFREKGHLFDLFLEHVNENAFIDFDSFKHDTELRKAIMNFKKDRENLQLERPVFSKLFILKLKGKVSL